MNESARKELDRRLGHLFVDEEIKTLNSHVDVEFVANVEKDDLKIFFEKSRNYRVGKPQDVKDGNTVSCRKKKLVGLFKLKPRF